MEQSSSSFKCRQIVVKELSDIPLVGFESSLNLNGWQYDIKRWSSPFDLNLPVLPKLNDNNIQGVNETIYFKPGVLDKNLGDLKVIKIEDKIYNGKTEWVPLVRAGSYFRFKTPFYYYSDSSIVQYIDRNQNRDNRNYIELSDLPNISAPILAASFKRDLLSGRISYKTVVNQRLNFTGIYSNGQELETLSDSGTIYWDNVDYNKKEFIVDHTIDNLYRLFFNRDYINTIGVEVNSIVDLPACEQLGISNGSGHYILSDGETEIFVQSYYLKNFPVYSDDTFHLYVTDGSVYEEWNRRESWWDMIFSPITNQYYVDKDLGIVYFASESSNDLPILGNEIIVAYSIALRIEYEPKTISDIIAFKANLNPITQSINQGFVCITHENLDPASITLIINKPKISETEDLLEYGPIEVGTDFAILTANVKSVSGINLPNVSVTFEMTPNNIGFLNGGPISYGITDGSGNAYSTYQPPNSADAIGFYSTLVRASTNPSYPEHKELVIPYLDPGLKGQEQNCYLYQIHKDDIILGYKTVNDFLDTLFSEQSPAWVTDSITRDQWDQEMIIKYNLKDFIEPTKSGETIVGRKVIVYQLGGVDNYDSLAINPVTGEDGAIMPIYPTLIEQITSDEDAATAGQWRVLYPEDALLDCGVDLPIAGYWLVGTRRIEFIAHCWSPYYNKEIYSNVIKAKLTLPDYMIGVYTNEANKKIPFGWKIITDTDNIASAINGATFITINPYIGPYPILDLVNGNAQTEYADAPFRTVGFQFKIT